MRLCWTGGRLGTGSLKLLNLFFQFSLWHDIFCWLRVMTQYLNKQNICFKLRILWNITARNCVSSLCLCFLLLLLAPAQGRLVLPLLHHPELAPVASALASHLGSLSGPHIGIILWENRNLFIYLPSTILSPSLLASAWCKCTQPPPGLSSPRQPGPRLSPGNSSHYLDIMTSCDIMTSWHSDIMS